MIGLTFTIDNIDTVLLVYNQIQIIKYAGTESDQPGTPTENITSLVDWVVVSGTDTYPIPIPLSGGTSFYQTYDFGGTFSDWYCSRYASSVDGGYSGWSDPILGEQNDLYYDPEFPKEVNYGSADQAIINRIRLFTGDPLDLRREYGEDAQSSIHPDGKTFQLDEKGWPVFITMGGKAFNDSLNPSVNGYKYLKFQEFIDETCVTCSGVTNVCGDTITKEISNGVDIWYYCFRHSDREIMHAYDTVMPPAGLTTETATSQAYMLQTAIDLLRKELWEDAIEDGAAIKDGETSYNPEGGLKIRKELLNDLKKDLDEIVNSLTLKGISGVLLD